ncbi:MAG TPA: type IV secretion system protein [Candidatus Megaira endosymbiont of Hartmannula sinica]|nr:type IV secretion system protein [Candidatus Megaera endosymbiont of Hartmannula sinica]
MYLINYLFVNIAYFLNKIRLNFTNLAICSLLKLLNLLLFSLIFPTLILILRFILSFALLLLFSKNIIFASFCETVPNINIPNNLLKREVPIYSYLVENLDQDENIKCTPEKNNIISFCLKNSDNDGCTSYNINLDSSINVKINDPKSFVVIDDISLYAKKINNLICVTIDSPYGFIPIACKKILNTSNASNKNASNKDNALENLSNNPDNNQKNHCSSSLKTCYKNKNMSSSVFNFSGLVVDCLRSNMGKIFFSGINGCEDNSVISLNSFSNFQQLMRGFVLTVIIIYIIVFGINIILEPGSFALNDIIISSIKILIVLYFSVGIATSSMSNNTFKDQYSYSYSEPADNSDQIHHNGLTEYVLPFLISLTDFFNELIFTSITSSGLCNFGEAEYKQGYEFYKLWDMIDCNLGGYMFYTPIYNIDYTGIILNLPEKDNNFNKHTPNALKDPAPFGLLIALVGFFISGNILMLIMTVAVVVMILSFCFYFLTFYIISIISLHVMIYIGPIFVPMVLFDRTKSYFMSWLKVTFSYALQPPVVLVFVIILFVIYEHSIFGSCEFNSIKHTIEVAIGRS